MESKTSALKVQYCLSLPLSQNSIKDNFTLAWSILKPNFFQGKAKTSVSWNDSLEAIRLFSIFFNTRCSFVYVFLCFSKCLYNLKICDACLSGLNMSELKARWIVSKVNRIPELNIAGPRTKWKFYLEIHWTCGIFQRPIINSENKLRWNCTCNCNYYLSHLKIYLSHEIPIKSHEVCHPVSLQFLWIKGAPFEVPYDPVMFHARGDRDQNWAAWHSLAVSRVGGLQGHLE